MRVAVTRTFEARSNLRAITASGVYDLVSRVMAEYALDSSMVFVHFLKQEGGFSGQTGVQKLDDTASDLRYNYSTSVGEDYASSSMTDEDSKINVSYAGLQVLEMLLIRVGGLSEDKAVELANNIIDWRDQDNERAGLQTINNEDSYYRQSGLPYTPKNAAFESPEELLLVLGMQDQIYQAIRPYITVYGSGKVNINTCSRQTLEMLGIPVLLVKKLLEFRRRHSSQEGLQPGIFLSPETIVKQLESVVAMEPDEKKILNDLIMNNVIGTDSQCFSIRCLGRYLNDTSYVDCVFSVMGGFRYWNEGFGRP